MAPVLPLCQPEVRLTFPRQSPPHPGLPPFCGIILLGNQTGRTSLTLLGEGECPQKRGPGLQPLPFRVPVAAQKADLTLQQGI